MSVLPVNGKITRIDVPAAPTSGGDLAWTNGSAISADCTIDEPSRAQQIRLGSLLAEVAVVIYVTLDDLPAGTQILEGYKVTAHQMRDATVFESKTYRIVKRELRVFGELTHYELFGKEL